MLRCGYLTSIQKVLIYTTHIKKVIAKLYSLPLRSKVTDRKKLVRDFAEVRNFAWHRATETYFNWMFFNGVGGRASGLQTHS